MKAPKLLPWIARKAGISDELALKLWRRAAGESEYICGCCDNSDYFDRAMTRFQDLVDSEAEAVSTQTLPPGLRSSWIWRHQKRMSQLHGLAAQNIYQLWQTAWPQSISPAKTLH